MKALIIYCHPSQKSYTYQVLSNLKSSLKQANIEYEVSDLYAMNFKSDMDENEYEREGFANLDLPIAEDVGAEQLKIEQADCIIFLYPLWWSDCPAKLKGWFDRVYSVGYAYGYNEAGEKIKQMKSIKYGLVICTAGHPNEFLKEIGIAESIRNVMLDDRLGQRFKHKELLILGGTLEIDKVRQQHANILRSIGTKIQSHVMSQ